VSSDTPLFNSDQHYYEPGTCFTRYMSRVHVERDVDEKDRSVMDEKPFPFLDCNFDRYSRATQTKRSRSVVTGTCDCDG